MLSLHTLSCLFRLESRLNVCAQTLHLYTWGTPCIKITCLFNVSNLLNFASQSRQLNLYSNSVWAYFKFSLFSMECTSLRCLRRWLFLENILSHLLHSMDFSPWTELTWRLKICSVDRILVQRVHGKEDGKWVWYTSVCFFKVISDWNNFEQIEHWTFPLLWAPYSCLFLAYFEA